jgi:hypothetical protein
MTVCLPSTSGWVPICIPLRSRLTRDPRSVPYLNKCARRVAGYAPEVLMPGYLTQHMDIRSVESAASARVGIAAPLHTYP